MGYWDHRKPVRRARAVDVEAIARESVELLDAGGLRALTIRAVAARLGVAPRACIRDWNPSMTCSISLSTEL